ncbi:MAG: SIMPL domain-containing protein, partial [Pseudomonadota bacterium]
MMTRGVTILVAAVVLALGMVAGGYLLGDGLTRARLADRAVTVRGLAERDVEADLATWTIRFAAQGRDFTAVKADAVEMETSVRRFLARQGFAADAIEAAGLSVSQWANSGGRNVQVRQTLRLATNDIARARAAYAAQGDLLEAGVAIEDAGPAMVYSFTRLTDLKPEMIAEATGDARAAAEQFARDSGATVAGIRSAQQGYFAIKPRDGAVGAAT